ncbi:MAG TPA: DUF4870 domain-containing protein, partial [Actinomycetaceae bacterium]|nr:DUF4870 domain-containing protein [Actinomycetaceae bacterium]
PGTPAAGAPGTSNYGTSGDGTSAAPGHESWTNREYDWDRGGYTEPERPAGNPYADSTYPAGGHYGDPTWTPQPGYSRDMRAGDEKTWATIAHLSAPIAMVFSAGWLGVVGPLLVWLAFRDRSAYVRAAAAASFNFNIVLAIANAIAYIMAFTVILLPVAILLWIAIVLGLLVFHISAAISSSRGELYKYPFNLQVLN